MPSDVTPELYRRFCQITADIKVPDSGASGVIIASGGSSAGFTLYLENGVPIYEYNFFDRARFSVKGVGYFAAGSHTIVLDFAQSENTETPLAGGIMTRSANGSEVAVGEIKLGVPKGLSTTETIDIGVDLGTVVSLNYQYRAPFAFSGTIERVAIKIQ
jgi:arylsulfatase